MLNSVLNQLNNTIQDLIPVATGTLRDNTRFVLEKNEGYEIKLKTEGYFNVVNNGREPGKFPPRDKIAEWITVKGITPSDISVDSLVYLISRKIARDGTEGTGMYEKTIEAVGPTRIGQAIARARRDECEKIIAKNI